MRNSHRRTSLAIAAAFFLSLFVSTPVWSQKPDTPIKFGALYNVPMASPQEVDAAFERMLKARTALKNHLSRTDRNEDIVRRLELSDDLSLSIAEYLLLRRELSKR